MTAVRFALLLSVIFAVVLTAAGLFIRDELGKQVREDIDADLVAYATTLAEDIEATGGIPGWLIGQDMEYFVGQSEAYQLANGQVFGSVHADLFKEVGFKTVPERALFNPQYFRFLRDEFLDEYAGELDPNETVSISEFQTSDRWRVYVAKAGDGRLAVYAPIAEVEEALELIPTILWPIGALIIMATLLAGLGLGFWQQTRINKINHALDQIAKGDLKHRIAPAKLRDDMDELAARVDQSAEQLDASIRQMRDFSHHVAHELKTPLARLRATLENAGDPASIEHALAQTDEVIHVFDAIQRISRMNNKGLSAQFEPVDLAELVGIVQDLYADVAEEAGQSLVVELHDPGAVEGDKQLLAQMLSNLVENSLRYAGANATIRLSAAPGLLMVQDNGPGLQGDSHKAIFDAFFTADHSDTRQGTGLGLALVKAIANFHDATADAQTAPGGGLLIRISFDQD